MRNRTKRAIPHHPLRRHALVAGLARKGSVTGKHARTGLLLGAAGLLAVTVDWVVEELRQHERERRPG
jgi:hypothetical protein